MPYQANRRKKSKIVGKKENLAKRKIQNGQKKMLENRPEDALVSLV